MTSARARALDETDAVRGGAGDTRAVRENTRRIAAWWLARGSSARRRGFVPSPPRAPRARSPPRSRAIARRARDAPVSVSPALPPQRVELDAIGPAPAATQGTRAVPSPTRRPARAPNAKTPPDGYGVGCSSRGLRAVRGRGNAPSWLAPRRCGEAQRGCFIEISEGSHSQSARRRRGDVLRGPVTTSWNLETVSLYDQPRIFPGGYSVQLFTTRIPFKTGKFDREHHESRLGLPLRCEETTAARRGAPLPSGAD